MSQNAAIQQKTKRQIQEVRKRALERYSQTLAERNKRLVEVAAKLQLTVSSIRQKHEFAKSRLSQETVIRDVHVRVNRSLEALEQYVRVLRESRVSNDSLDAAIRDPTISGSLFDRERRASVSDLLQSVQKQLIQETEFINVAAHELRTPIMPILLNAELLESQLQGTGSEEVTIIVRNALRLKTLAENILSAAAVDSNSLELNRSRFDLNLLIRQLVEDKKYAIESKEVRLLFISQNDELPVVADSDRMGQAISNLLDNAIKFTGVGEILVTSEMLGNSVVVSVSDSGPGIDSRLFPVLFSKFVGKSQKGTGLGLYITKNIIEAHGGTISARNKVEFGKTGATLTFTIPIDESHSR